MSRHKWVSSEFGMKYTCSKCGLIKIYEERKSKTDTRLDVIDEYYVIACEYFKTKSTPPCKGN